MTRKSVNNLNCYKKHETAEKFLWSAYRKIRKDYRKVVICIDISMKIGLKIKRG